MTNILRALFLLYLLIIFANFLHTAWKWEQLKRQWDAAAIVARRTQDYSKCEEIFDRELRAMDDQWDWNVVRIARNWHKVY